MVPGTSEYKRVDSETDHTPAESRLLEVHAPVLVVMGEMDPDFKDAQAEAEWTSEALNAQVVMVPEAGHYPQSQQPQITAAAAVLFISEVTSGG
jgi:pimeloyl-ACP methyl ester carboxylesterase